MKRDWETIITLASAMEQGGLAECLLAHGEERPRAEYHLSLMQQAGLCNGICLTMEGQDLLALARNYRAWDEVRAKIKEFGGLPYEVVKSILMRQYEADNPLPPPNEK